MREANILDCGLASPHTESTDLPGWQADTLALNV